MIVMVVLEEVRGKEGRERMGQPAGTIPMPSRLSTCVKPAGKPYPAIMEEAISWTVRTKY
jgi:hypothetical protein